MYDQLKHVVIQLNARHDAGPGDEASREVMKILNAHHQSLAFLNSKAADIDRDVSTLETEVHRL